MRICKLSRREFLGISGVFISLPLRAARLHSSLPTAIPTGEAQLAEQDYRLSPHYRDESPLDSVIRFVEPGADAFPLEKEAAQIEAVLATWSAALASDPCHFEVIAESISPELAATPLFPREVQPFRSGKAFGVQRLFFPSDLSLDRTTFLPSLRSWVADSGRTVTAEFKVPSLKLISGSPRVLQTQIRYDLVTTSHELFRGQRVGYWDLEWEADPIAGWRVRKWRAIEETRSQARDAVFVEITAGAFRGVPSYSDQLLRGIDYWRTVLDAATGINIYGNSGIACGDIDNDGFDDLYICQPNGLPNRLYHNRGDATFEDITDASGVGLLDNTSCALFADVDNDGNQDLLVVLGTGPVLFVNQGNGTFRLKADAFHFAQEPQGIFTGAAFGDYDRDGWLDLYLCVYSYYQGLDQYRYPSPYFDAQNGPPSFMFRNNRDGTFSDVTAATGLTQNNNRYGFDCSWVDFDRDGWPDLYKVNDFGRKNLYRNLGNGKFANVAEEAGVLDIGPGMSCCWFDYDNDGRLDLYVCDMWEPPGLRVTMQEGFMKDVPSEVRALYRRHAKGNSLFWNTGSGKFEDRSASAGVEHAGWSWSSYAWDFDHDGYQDLYITTGMISGPDKRDLQSFFWRQVVSKSPSQARPLRPYEQGWNAINELIRSDMTWAGYQRNVLYSNNRDGTFSNAGGALGLDFPDDSRGFALADYDHDGRLEIFLKNRTGPQLRLLRCEMNDVGNSIAFKLRGHKSNRDSIGAEITIETETGRQTKFLQAGTGFLSQHTKEIFFGVGDAQKLLRTTIRWPSGIVQEFKDLPANKRIQIEEGSEQLRLEAFQERTRLSSPPSVPRANALPTQVETWLIDPVSAPDFNLLDLEGHSHDLKSRSGRLLLLNFWTVGSNASHQDLQLFREAFLPWSVRGLQLVTLNVDEPQEETTVRKFAAERSLTFTILLASQDTAAIYNLLYRYLFDRRRNMGIPTSFLVNEGGMIVKVYQGPLNREHLEADVGRIPRTSAQRISMAVPFTGSYIAGEPRRNHFTYGVAFAQRGYLDQAIVSFQQVVANHPDDVEGNYNLGTIYIQKHERTEAEKYLRRVLELRPDHPDALNNLGLLAANQGETDKAIAYFGAAIKKNPNHVVALENLGKVYRRNGELNKAQQTLERALQIDPEDPDVNYSLGMVFAEMKDYGRARVCLQTTLRLRPTYPEALNNLGVVYILDGNPEEAAARFKECITLAPDFDQPYLNLARLYVSQGERGKAQAILHQLLERNGEHSAVRKMLDSISH